MKNQNIQEAQTDQEPQFFKSRKHVGRKRFREPDKHIKSLRKQRRNTGQEYTTGKTVPAKTFSDENCNRQKKCFEKISALERKKNFEKFWMMGDFTAQNAFMCGLVKQKEIKRARVRDGSKASKTVSNYYYVYTGNISHNVCKQYFLRTLQVSN